MKLKYLLVIVLFAFLSCELFAQEVGERLPDGTLINYVDINKKKQGKWIKKYPSGKVKYEGQFENDIPIGTFKYYYSNGKMKSYLVYHDDHSATVDMFWENGKRFANGDYDAEKNRHSLWKMYNEHGSLIAEIPYNHGHAEGNVKIYYPDSDKLVLDCNYKDGMLHGYYKKYFKNGKLQEEGPYKERAKHGHWKLYSPTGMLEEEGEYVEGYREGEWKDYRKKAEGEIVTYTKGQPDNFDELMEEWHEKQEWAKQNQDKFKQPEDYFDNPMEFFRDNTPVDYGKTRE